MIANGERSTIAIRQQIESQISTIDKAVIDYVAVVNAYTLNEMETLKGSTLLAVAVKFGATRLIDNVRIEV